MPKISRFIIANTTLILVAFLVFVDWARHRTYFDAQRNDPVAAAIAQDTAAQIAWEASHNTFEGTVTRVTDGDTIWVTLAHPRSNDVGRVKVRLDRIDAPEKDQAYGKKATAALSNKIMGKQVVVYWQKRDRYGRILGTVVYNGEDINHWMVLHGHAWHYVQFDQSPEFIRAQKIAQENRLGLWADKNPVYPQDWRRRKDVIGENVSSLF